jgi:asparagine synthase (glutamine-hydrolysing)
MCGIAGIVSTELDLPVSEAVLVKMRDSIAHRGPDDAGHYLEPGIGLASRRLAILDLSPRGHMPMRTPDGRYWIVYNGEVYNYRSLRARLEGRGYQFESNTDTEVLLAAFADEGPAMLHRLNGMFAFAIWDTRERQLFIARDRLGVKPLYYCRFSGALYFGSEEKVLFAAGIPAEFDSSTWEELLSFCYVAGERTPFLGVKRLLPGHYLRWKDGEIEIQPWWNLAERVRERRDDPPRDPAQWFRNTFDDAVNLRRISDVPVGVLLSGGLDSSSVAASLAQQAGSGAASFTVRFAEAQYDEGPLAQQVADRWGLLRFGLTIPHDELLARLRRACWFNDEPLAHASDVHIGAISQFAKSRVTVLLSGEGADETLGGYVRYRPLRHPLMLAASRALLPLLQPVLATQPRLRKLGRFLKLGGIDKFVLYNSTNIFPEDLESVGFSATGYFPYREQVLDEAKELHPGEPMRQAMHCDLHAFLCSLLDRNDRMTMGASIECRVPFLDYRLVEGLAAMSSQALLAGRQSKPLLRAAVGDRLPPAILSGRKWGFAVPWSRHLREVPDLREHVMALPEQAIIQDGPFDQNKLRATVNQFLSGDGRQEALIKQLFVIALWHEVYFGQVKSAAREKAMEPTVA